MSGKRFCLADKGLGGVISPVASSEVEEREKRILFGEHEFVTSNNTLFDAHPAPDSDKSDTRDVVSQRTAFLDRRTDVWVKRPAQV
ncbi:hypothetical protein [Aromatoleum toluclasticum]|uniref:hypothetical protein n=1 Tax=Aromatoleum toluclasticum TaxID=92003 RepID=UPI000366AFB8|nr:hypothetical protein [Aromatoleum toluclasticum]